LADVVRHSTDEARLLAMQRLDALRVRLVGIATDDTVNTRDQVSALRVLLNVEQREAALLGLDAVAAPVVTGDILDAELDRLTREIGKLDAPRSATRGRTGRHRINNWTITTATPGQRSPRSAPTASTRPARARTAEDEEIRST